jgi:hypothetical protein
MQTSLPPTNWILGGRVDLRPFGWVWRRRCVIMINHRGPVNLAGHRVALGALRDVTKLGYIHRTLLFFLPTVGGGSNSTGPPATVLVDGTFLVTPASSQWRRRNLRLRWSFATSQCPRLPFP